MKLPAAVPLLNRIPLVMPVVACGPEGKLVFVTLGVLATDRKDALIADEWSICKRTALMHIVMSAAIRRYQQGSDNCAWAPIGLAASVSGLRELTDPETRFLRVQNLLVAKP